jgi:hypothetical protein
MGDKQNQAFQLSFNPSLKVEFQGSRVTSDGGLILVRELDERLGFGELIEEHLTDPRRGKNTQFPLADLLRQSIYRRLAGYEDVNDAERLSQDATFRLIGSEKIWERDAALTSRLPDKVHSADGWEELLLPEGPEGTPRQQKQGKEVVFRADAAFAKPEIYEALEERGVKYAMRLPANDCLERDIAELLTRPVGRPGHKPVVRFYNQRRTAEQGIKEGRHAVKMTRLSCHRLRSNEVRLWVSAVRQGNAIDAIVHSSEGFAESEE